MPKVLSVLLQYTASYYTSVKLFRDIYQFHKFHKLKKSPSSILIIYRHFGHSRFDSKFILCMLFSLNCKGHLLPDFLQKRIISWTCNIRIKVGNVQIIYRYYLYHVFGNISVHILFTLFFLVELVAISIQYHLIVLLISAIMICYIVHSGHVKCIKINTCRLR